LSTIFSKLFAKVASDTLKSFSWPFATFLRDIPRRVRERRSRLDDHFQTGLEVPPSIWRQ
jgi:hypothetical protein